MVAEVFEVVMGAAGFVAGHTSEAAVDGLAFETETGGVDFGDDVAAGELGGAGALVESFEITSEVTRRHLEGADVSGELYPFDTTADRDPATPAAD